MTNTWSVVAAPSSGASTATLLPSGKVLAVGIGFSGQTNPSSIYDPVTNIWTSTGNTAYGRQVVTAILLPNGKVLLAGGSSTNGNVLVTNTELCDDGLQYPPSSRPIITSATSPLYQNLALTLSGTQFKGIAEASGSATNNSAANFPVVQLRNTGNNQIVMLPVDSTHPFSDTAFKSIGLPTGFPAGYSMATVFTNGIPSQSALVQVVNGIGILPPTLPNAQVGVAYNQPITGLGGNPPYTVTKTGGTLPAGLTFSNGAISGTPTAGGVFSVAITVTDSTPSPGTLSLTNTYSLTVAAPTITIPALANGQVGVAFNPIVCTSWWNRALQFVVTITTGALPPVSR